MSSHRHAMTSDPVTKSENSPNVATTHTVLRSSEFTCPSCVAKIERQLLRLPGVSSATVRFATGRIDVDHDPSVITVQDLVDAVARAGYRATPATW